MRSEYIANLHLQESAPRIGATFHQPAPIRARRNRPGFFARVIAFIRSV